MGRCLVSGRRIDRRQDGNEKNTTMTGFEFVAFWGLAMLAGMAANLAVAALKNRDGSYWAFWGFVFPPSVLILLLAPKRKGPPIRRMPWDHQDHLDELHHNPPH